MVAVDDMGAFDKTSDARPIARAVKTIAETMGLADTMVDVLRARAFKPFAEGLRQYLTIRLGDVEQGADALAELRLVVAGERATALIEPPGVRAQLYSRARALVGERWAEGEGSHGDRDRLPWRKPAAGVSLRYRSALAMIRQELTEEEAELLELRFARELMVEELAFVLDLSSDQVERRIEEAKARVRRLIEGLFPDPEIELGTMLLEAFALEPPPESAKGAPGAVSEGLPAGTIIGDRYRVEELVGSGGMGNVYRASDTEVPGHTVALKLLHQPANSEFAREAALRELHLIASVFHPSVVQFKDHGWSEGRLWFVMPWYEGETLETRLKRHPLSRSEARPIFQQLARALATMHSVGIRHQDIKPDNIFLAKIEGLGLAEDQEVLPVLIDLGVAAKEAELVLAGTPIYFAPEVAAQYARVAEPHAVTAKADVFSLCLSLRNAISPESQETVTAGAVEQFIEKRAKTPPDPPASEDLTFLKPHFERWLALDPGERPSADELAEELEVLTRPEDRRVRRNAILRWLAPLLLAVIAVFGSVVYGLNRRAEFQKLEAAQARVREQHALNQAERAKLEAFDVRQDLSVAEEQVASLEKRISKTIRASKMTQEELTTKLARAESLSQVLQERLTLTRRRAVQLEGQRDEAREERDRAQERGRQLEGDLDRTRSELGSARGQITKLGQSIDELRAQLATVRGTLEETEARAAGLTGRVAALEDQLEAERASVARLEARLSEAERARTEAEAQLATARRQIAQLERQVSKTRRPTPGPGSGGAGSGDSGGSPTDPTGGEAPPPPPKIYHPPPGSGVPAPPSE